MAAEDASSTSSRRPRFALRLSDSRNSSCKASIVRSCGRHASGVSGALGTRGGFKGQRG